MEIKEFIKKYGDLNRLDGNHYRGSLYLGCTGITSLPEGLTVGGGLYLRGTGVTALPEGLTVGGYLDLEGCTGVTSLPDGLTVGGYLDLRGTGVTALPEGLTVGGGLDLEGCTGVTALPEGLTVGGDLYLRGTGVTALPEGLTVGGGLDLEGCTGVTALPEGLTVGGSLYLIGTGVTALPEGLTVGGGLDLRGTGITSLPEGLTVGGGLDLEGCTGVTETDKVNRSFPSVLTWEFHGRKYIKADGIFQRVISTRGNVYRVRRIGKTEDGYLVTDGAGKWSHGETLEEARRNLLYKIGDRDTTKYRGLTLDSVLPLAEAIECYRVITGACAAGTKHFMEDVLPQADRRVEYSIADMIRLTDGQYGAKVFEDFFYNQI